MRRRQESLSPDASPQDTPAAEQATSPREEQWELLAGTGLVQRPRFHREDGGRVGTGEEHQRHQLKVRPAVLRSSAPAES